MSNDDTSSVMNYLVDPSTIRNAFTGFLIGAGGLLGVKGLVEGIDSIKRSIFPIPKIPTEIVVDINKNKEKDKLHKTAGDWGNYGAMGFGIPIGLYSAYKFLNYLDKAQDNIDFANKVKKLENLYEEKYSKGKKNENIGTNI